MIKTTSQLKVFLFNKPSLLGLGLKAQFFSLLFFFFWHFNNKVRPISADMLNLRFNENAHGNNHIYSIYDEFA